MTPGERILQEIIKQGMVSVAYPQLDSDQPVVFTWAANSEEQLTALVEEIRKEDE